MTRYFLVLALIFAFIIPQLIDFIRVFSYKHGMFMDEIINKFFLSFVMGYTDYFLLGYFINVINISGRLERMICIMGFLGLIATVLMSLTASLVRNAPDRILYGNLTFNMLAESTARIRILQETLYQTHTYYQDIIAI